MQYPTLDQWEVLDGRTVFVRVDFNVSLTSSGEIRDDSRLKSSLETLKELRSKGAKLVLASHLGRPKGEKNPRHSLLPVAGRLAELLGVEVIAPEDCVGMEVKKLIQEAKSDQVILLENLRFHSEEESCDESFSEKLASLADVYVNDAFGTMHRAHASTFGMVKHFQEKAIGRLVEKEVASLGRLITEPEKPFTVVLGGAKVSDKIAVIENLLPKAQRFVVGGGMAYTFLKAQGVDVGESLVEDQKLSLAREILSRAEKRGIEFLLPVDSVVASEMKSGIETQVIRHGDSFQGLKAFDIGPKSRELFAEGIRDSKMIFWNGPLGVYEVPEFQEGTCTIAKAVAETSAFQVVGGGDSLAAINETGFANAIAHLSTGGGASLTFLEGEELPGLRALK